MLLEGFSLFEFDLTESKSCKNLLTHYIEKEKLWAPLNTTHTHSLWHTVQSHSVNHKTINVHLKFKWPPSPYISTHTSQTNVHLWAPFILTEVLLMSLSGQQPAVSVPPGSVCLPSDSNGHHSNKPSCGYIATLYLALRNTNLQNVFADTPWT